MSDPRAAQTAGGLADYLGADMDDGTCLAVQCQERPSADDGLCDKHRIYAKRKNRPGVPTRIVNDLQARLWSKIEKDADTGCWNWTASLTYGYGQVMMPDKKPRRVHRLMYELMVGPIPDGLQIDHLCRNRRCCNPEHLEPVTPRINTQRAVRIATDEVCANGHPWEGNKIVRLTDGVWACRTCNREKMRRHRARKRNAA